MIKFKTDNKKNIYKKTMEIDIDVYFWLVDRGVYDDDQRNKVDMERNKVRMHREHSQRLENGYYLAKLMMVLKKSVVKISRKPFSLDPNLANMKDNITSTSKQLNWSIIIKELKKFGIRVDSEKKVKIIEGNYILICDILAKLFEFDNGGGISRFNDANSDFNGGSGNRDHSLNGLNNQNESTNISIDGKDSMILLGKSPSKRRELDPISQNSLLKSQKKQSSKLPSALSPNVKKVKVTSVNQSVTSLNEINEQKDLGDTETTLEFILLSLSKNLGIKPKQAAGLLSNNHKYLIHIAVKGMKGNDFSKMLAWYQGIYGFAKHITQLIDNEKDSNAMKLTLNILKCGLYSQSPQLVITCSRVLSKIGQEINLMGGQMSGLAWDWFIDNSQNGQGSTQSMDQSPVRDLSPLNVAPALNESGLASCLFALKKNQSDSVESVVPVLVHFGRNNYLEFFTYHLRRQFTGENQRTLFISQVHDIVMALAGSSLFNDAFVTSGVLDDLLSQAIRMGDFDPSGANTIKDRVAAMSFLADAWEVKADRIQENQEVAQAILTVLKRGCRDRTRMLRTVAFEQMFKLLHHFSVNRNEFAPIIYKSLTFLLIEFHTHVEIREQLMRDFGTLFQQVQTIPVAILCEPLLKQIAITGPGMTDFNIFDFEFFGIVANHKRATVSIGLQIVDTMVAQATSQVFYSNSATSIVLELVHRFSREQPMHSHMSKVVETLISSLDEAEKWKKSNGGAISENTSTIKKGRTMRTLDAQQTEQQTVALARKMRERLIVNFLKQVILFGIELVKEDVRTQLLRAYARLEKQQIKHPKSLHYLLELYRSEKNDKTDVPQMLQYFIEQEKGRSRKSRPAQLASVESSVDQQMDEYLLDAPANLGDESALFMEPPRKMTRAQLHLEKVMHDIEKIKTNKNDRTDRRVLEVELRKVKDEQMKVQAKKQVERRQLEHGVLPLATTNKKGVTRGVSVDQRQMNPPRLDKDGLPLEIKILKIKDTDDISEINITHDRMSLLPEEQAKGKKAAKNNVLKKLKEFQLFDLRFEEQKDQDAVRFFVKKNLKVLRNLFQKYGNSSNAIHTVQQTFEDIQKQNQWMTVSEALKMLKDFQVSILQVTQKDLVQMFRAINKDILKKKDPVTKDQVNQVKVTMTALDFEGFVEFLMQVAVHLYSYDSAMTPGEYLQRLFDHFRQAAAKTGSNILRLFQAAGQEEPLMVSGVLDNKLLAELNRRLQVDPQYPMPEGYSKVTEREIVSKFTIPAYFAISEGKRVAIEVLDGLLAELFGVHIIEPMAEVKEMVRARANLKKVMNDKIMGEIATSVNKNALIVTKPKKPRVSSSIDVHPVARILPKKIPNASSVSSDVNSKAEIRSEQLPSPNKGRSKERKPKVIELPPAPKLQLGVTLKLEIAKTPAGQRAAALEAAYALEEILCAVEAKQTLLPRLQKETEKKKPVNKVIEERIKKVEDEEKQKASERSKLDLRKKLLKEQLDQMKIDKVKKDKEDLIKKKAKDVKTKEKEKKNHDKLIEDMTKLKVEFSAKKNKKKEDEAKIKPKALPVVDPVKKAEEVKAVMKLKKQTLRDEFAVKIEDRKNKVLVEEEAKSKKINSEKAKSSKIKQMYADTKLKASERKQQRREEYEGFRDSNEVKKMFQSYERALQTMFENYSKFDSVLTGKEGGALSYNAYMKMGAKIGISPSIISSQDYVYVFKTMMKNKKNTEKESGIKYENMSDVQGTKLTFPEFKEALLKIACLGKYKLGGGANGVVSPEDEKAMKDINKQKMKQALADAATTGVLKKPKEEGEEGNVNEDLINVFEKEFDINDMTQQTIESLFKVLNLKPDRPEKTSPKPVRRNPAASERLNLPEVNVPSYGGVKQLEEQNNNDQDLI